MENSKTAPHIHFKQPKVLYLSFLTAMSERFGYYIIGFLLTLYAKCVYNFSDSRAFGLFATFTALGYLTPAIGGWLADNFIGIKRCLALGLTLEGAGYVLLAIPTESITIFSIALATVIIGAGIFKTAPTNLLGRSYKTDDPRIDAGFTFYYMGINIGSLVSSVVAGSIQEAFGWHVPFIFAAGGLFLGLIWFVLLKKQAKGLESRFGEKKFSLTKWGLTLLGCMLSIGIFAYFMYNQAIGDIVFYTGSSIILLYFAYEIVISPKEEKIKIAVCLALIFMAVVFFLLYFQLYTSMELFIKRNVNRNFFGFEIPTVYFLGLNGLWIIILSPIYASIYKRLRSRGNGIAITTKFPMGILLIALSFFSLTLACSYFENTNSQIESYWIVVAIFLYSAGELFTSALGVAMVTRIAPQRMYGIMMGAWYLIATALAAELSGIVAQMASIPENLVSNLHATLQIYSGAFLKMGYIGLGTAVIGFFLSPWLRRAANID